MEHHITIPARDRTVTMSLSDYPEVQPGDVLYLDVDIVAAPSGWTFLDGVPTQPLTEPDGLCWCGAYWRCEHAR